MWTCLKLDQRVDSETQELHSRTRPNRKTLMSSQKLASFFNAVCVWCVMCQHVFTNTRGERVLKLLSSAFLNCSPLYSLKQCLSLSPPGSQVQLVCFCLLSAGMIEGCLPSLVFTWVQGLRIPVLLCVLSPGRPTLKPCILGTG